MDNLVLISLASFHSSFFLVIVVQIAVLALPFGIDQSIGMGAISGITVPSILVIAVVAHAFGVVFLVFMRTFQNFHSFPLGILEQGIISLLWRGAWGLSTGGADWVFFLVVLGFRSWRWQIVCLMLGGMVWVIIALEGSELGVEHVLVLGNWLSNDGIWVVHNYFRSPYEKLKKIKITNFFGLKILSTLFEICFLLLSTKTIVFSHEFLKFIIIENSQWHLHLSHSLLLVHVRENVRYGNLCAWVLGMKLLLTLLCVGVVLVLWLIFHASEVKNIVQFSGLQVL